jgi:hypothetical protein
MKKFKVRGQYTITVMKEVWANDEDEAINKADKKFGGVVEYVGNGGYDKLVGVSESDESVAADGMIEWEDAEELEDDPDYFECPSCEEECEACESDDGFKYWHCTECDTYYDEDGDEFYPDVEEEDE